MKPNVESVRPPITIKAGGRPSLARSTVSCTALVWRKRHVCSQSTFAQRTSHDFDEETVQTKRGGECSHVTSPKYLWAVDIESVVQGAREGHPNRQQSRKARHQEAHDCCPCD